MDDIEGYILIFSISLASTILFRALLIRRQTRLNLPPSPFALPIIGHFHHFKPPPHRAFQKLSNRYGPVVYLYLGSIPHLIVSSAEIAKEILKFQEISFTNRSPNAAISYMTYDGADFAFAPYGAYWKFMKKLCMTELLNGRMLDQLLPIRFEEINNFLQMIHQKSQVGEAVNLTSELLRLMNSIVMRMAMGKSSFKGDDEAREVITKRVKESTKLCGEFNLSDYFWFCKNIDLRRLGKRLKDLRQKFDASIEIIIKEHEEARKKSNNKDAAKDILDALLSVLEDESSEVKITRQNIKGFLMDILAGGTDTTAIALEWAIAELINHPTVMEKARKEIDSVVGKDRVVSETDVANLPYIQAVVKETLRLHPPGSLIVRQSTENCTIAGYDIPVNTRVFINVWAIGRDPKYWDNPDEFHPERFLIRDDSGMKSQFDVRGQHYQFLPFGSGRRGCPGVSLAFNVAQTTLAAMIQCFEWGVGASGNGSTVDMQEGDSLTLSRAHPLICIPRPRLNPFPILSC